MKTFKHLAEAIALYILLFVFRLLPASIASSLGGWMGRKIGAQLKSTNRRAMYNLKRAMPELSNLRVRAIIGDMWEHLGRVFAEYPHLADLAFENTQILGYENLQKALKDPNGAIFFGGHIGNWEISAAALYIQHNYAMDLSYRAPNNPWADRLLYRARTLNGRIKAHPKSRRGGKKMIDAVKNGGTLGILIDQKYNEGIRLPFFGIEALTNPFFVQLAQKYKSSLVPARVTRLNGANFSVTVHSALKLFDDDGTPRPVADIVIEAQKILENFIRETPEQWLWMHRRWPVAKKKPTVQRNEN